MLKALNKHRNLCSVMAFNEENVLAKQCLSGRMNTDCYLSFDRFIKNINRPLTHAEIRDW
jgi:hypothetical protein